MVGHADADDDIAERKCQCTEKPWVGEARADDVVKDSYKENKTVECAKGQDKPHDDSRKVGSCLGHEHLIQLVGDEHEKGKQGMPVYIVTGVPIGDNHVRYRVEAGNVELHEQPTVVVVQGKKLIRILVYDQWVPKDHIQEG